MAVVVMKVGQDVHIEGGSLTDAINEGVRQGYVVDFFYFSLINFPIFNVADIYVTAAAFLLIFLCLFYYKEEDFEQIFPSGSSRQHSSEKKDND